MAWTMVAGELSPEDKALVKKALYEVEEALRVLKSRVERGVKDLGDAFAIRYALIQIVEGLAIVASRLAEARGAVVEGYVEAMEFLVRAGVVDSRTGEGLAKLARLRNLLVHRYWRVDDERIVREAKRGGVKVVEEAIERVRRLIEG